MYCHLDSPYEKSNFAYAPTEMPLTLVYVLPVYVIGV